MDNLQLPHKITLDQGHRLTATGVTEVIRFDDISVILATPLGELELRGEGLALKSLSPDGGQFVVEGQITGLSYATPRPDGFWRRLFP